MSLREEIIELTLDNFHYNDRKISIKQFSDEIISKIEKRIDSIKMPSDFQSHEMEYAVGFGEAITEVKEMLK